VAGGGEGGQANQPGLRTGNTLHGLNQGERGEGSMVARERVLMERALWRGVGPLDRAAGLKVRDLGSQAAGVKGWQPQQRRRVSQPPAGAMALDRLDH